MHYTGLISIVEKQHPTLLPFFNSNLHELAAMSTLREGGGGFSTLERNPDECVPRRTINHTSGVQYSRVHIQNDFINRLLTFKWNQPSCRHNVLLLSFFMTCATISSYAFLTNFKLFELFFKEVQILAILLY